MANKTVTFTVSVKEGQANPLVITPEGGSLPDQTVGTAVDEKLCDISGGTAPYTFEVTAGALPDGIRIEAADNGDGTTSLFLAGTPTTAGDNSFDLTVTDAAGGSSTTSVSRSVV